MNAARFIIPPADPAPRAPGWAVRPGGWDCHAHVFGPAADHPVREDALYDAPDQPGAAYRAMLDALGLGFGVLVQPSVYGDDHGAMFAAMREAPGRLFGVVDLDLLALSDAEVARMQHLGVLGLRVRPAAGTAERLLSLAARAREIGWHLDLYFENIAGVQAFAPTLRAARTPLIVEAMGEPKPGEPFDGEAFATLLSLIHDGTCWVKLSHAYHIDHAGPPYPAATPFARALIDAAPRSCVWGSDWPHPMRGGPVPNDGVLLDLLFEWADRDAERANRILVENPARFYAR